MRIYEFADCLRRIRVVGPEDDVFNLHGSEQTRKTARSDQSGVKVKAPYVSQMEQDGYQWQKRRS